MSCKVRYFDLEVSAYNKTKIDKSIKTCIARIFLNQWKNCCTNGRLTGHENMIRIINYVGIL